MRRALVVGLLVLMGCGSPSGQDGGSGGGSGGSGGGGGPGGGGGSGGNTLTGPRAFPVARSNALRLLLPDGGPNLTQLHVMLVSDPASNPCTGVGATGPMEFVLVNVGTGDGGAVLPATIAIGGAPWLGGPGAFVDRATALTGGGLGNEAVASAGTVTLTAIGAGGTSGSFSVTLTERDGGATTSLAGTFTSTQCP